MADHGFWNYAQRHPNELALIDPGGREWSRGELLRSFHDFLDLLDAQRAQGTRRRVRLGDGGPMALP